MGRLALIFSILMIMVGTAHAADVSRSANSTQQTFTTLAMRFGGMVKADFQSSCRFKPAAVVSELEMMAGPQLSISSLFLGDPSDRSAIDEMGVDLIDPNISSARKADWQWLDKLAYLGQICEARINKYKDELMVKCTANPGTATQSDFYVVYDRLCTGRNE